MTSFATQSNIDMGGPGILGSDVSGASRRKSKLITIGAGLTLSGGALVNTLDLTPYALLPDTLPAVGTLLSYGGSRQLAAGGTVTHGGNLDLQTSSNSTTAFRVRNAAGVAIAQVDTTNRLFVAGGDAFAVRVSTGGTYLFNGGFLAVTNSTDASSATADTFLSRASAGVWRFGTTSTGATAGIQCGAITASGVVTATSVLIGSGWFLRTAEIRAESSTIAFRNYNNTTDAALTCGTITASGNISTSGSINGTSILCDGSTVFDTSGYRLDCGVAGGFNTLTVPVLLQLGGTTSSYPAIKRSGTTTAFRLADDSADGPISCAGITASPDSGYPNAKVLVVNPNIDSSLFPGSTVGAALAFTYYGSGDRRGGIGVNNSGHFVVGSFANNVYNEIKFAGSATTYRTGTHVFRNAADSADGPITCGAITASGAVTSSSFIRSGDYLSIGLTGVNAIYANYQGRVSLINTGYFGIGAGDAAGSTADVVLGRDSANVWGMYTSSAMSSFAGLKVGAITASSTVTVGSNDGASGRVTVGIGLDWGLKFGNRGTIGAYNDGVFGFRNNATTSGAILDVSTDAAFKLRNRDNSADAALTCGAVTASGLITTSWDNGGTQSINLGNNIGFTQLGQHLLIGSRLGAATYYYVDADANTGDMRLPSVGSYGITNGNAYAGTMVVKLSRNATGPKWTALANGGLEIRNLANSADAALTCGAITASGVLTITSSAGSHIITGPAGASGGTTAIRISDAANATFRLSFENSNRIMFSGNEGAHNLSFGGKSGDTGASVFVERLRVDNIANTVNCYVPLSCGAITASGAVTVTSGSVISNTGMFQALASGQNMFLLNSAGTSYGSIGNDAGDKWSLGYKASSSTALGTPVLTWTVAGFVGINKVSPTVALDVNGAITASAIPSLGVPVLSAKSTVDTTSATVEFYSHTNNPIFTLKQHPSTAASGILTNVSQINGLNTISVGSGSAFGSSSEAININSGNMVVGYDGSGMKGYVGTRLAAGLSLYTNNVERLSISLTGAITASGAIQETPTQSALDPTTTDIPTGKAKRWYNSTLNEVRDWVNIGGTLFKSAAYT